MELTLADAIRLHRLIEVDADESTFLVEPYALIELNEAPHLRAFAVEGPRMGWVDFPQWSNVKVTRQNFSRRNPPNPQ